MHIEEILIVRNDKVCFGIPTATIGQILRIPELTSLYLSPNGVRGLCAVGGNILTAIDMNISLGMACVDTESSMGRILSLQPPFDTSALLVSEVLVSVIVDQSRIELVENPDDAIVAIYHHGDELVQILDVSKIINAILPLSVELSPITEKNGAIRINDKNNSTLRYLIFRMGEETFALEVENLREILALHQPLTQLSGANPEVAGMISLREQILVVADLRIYCGFEPLKNDKNRILIVETDNKTIGLIIDEIIDIREYAEDKVDRFVQVVDDERISGVIHDPAFLISLLGERVVQDIINRNKSILVTSDELREDEKNDVVMDALIFKLGNEEYALPIEEVAEIIDTLAITPISLAPDMVEGVINIRGQIVTIGSLYKKLGITMKSDHEHKIIVCHTPKGRMGFFVDFVSDVIQVHANEILEDVQHGELFSKVLNFDNGKRLVLLFDLSTLYGNGSMQ
ncbi:MAG: chemotaxis protein CheW [Sulfuricurvum sp.]|uniref:chemotaxis protein CheW n=1 Tax=Sulfuricurvum sp. TaxID=2025608 RepID=UPI0025E6B73A|nr:chemotaxis protein CheW [Sulfuricurvum sp.]MBV5320434.1 chemotaxis protein CheW [Sulfuricurvum sp.]